MPRTDEALYGVVREGCNEYVLADVLADVQAAVESYVQACEDTFDGERTVRHLEADLGAECARALPAVHELLGVLTSRTVDGLFGAGA